MLDCKLHSLLAFRARISIDQMELKDANISLNNIAMENEFFFVLMK